MIMISAMRITAFSVILCLTSSLHADPTEFENAVGLVLGAVHVSMRDTESHTNKAMATLAEACQYDRDLPRTSPEVVQAQQALVAEFARLQPTITAARENCNNPKIALKQFDELYGRILSQARGLGPQERQQFLLGVIEKTMIAQQGAKIAPEQLLIAANEFLGGTKLLSFHAKHHDAGVYAIVAAAVLYVAFKAAQFVRTDTVRNAYDPDALLHIFFGRHVRSIGEGVVDAGFTPLQLAVAPKATIAVKPLLSAAVLGTCAGLAATLLK